jgi:hypothetical protein
VNPRPKYRIRYDHEIEQDRDGPIGSGDKVIQRPAKENTGDSQRTQINNVIRFYKQDESRQKGNGKKKKIQKKDSAVAV